MAATRPGLVRPPRHVLINDLHALKILIAETLRGRPYTRSRFAREHPDLFGLLERGKGENRQQ